MRARLGSSRQPGTRQSLIAPPASAVTTERPSELKRAE
jgi:hypothetical protein